LPVVVESAAEIKIFSVRLLVAGVVLAAGCCWRLVVLYLFRKISFVSNTAGDESIVSLHVCCCFLGRALQTNGKFETVVAL